MSWKERLGSLVRKYGPGAKFVAGTVLSALVPGSPLAGLVLQALDLAQESADDTVRARLLALVEGNASELDRLGEVLGLLEEDLGTLSAQVYALQGVPGQARQILDLALAGEGHWQQAVQRLQDLNGEFACVRQQVSQLLEGQEQMRPLLERAAGVADWVCEWRQAGLSPADLHHTLEQVRSALTALGEGQVRAAEEGLEEVAREQPDLASAQVALAGVAVVQHRLPTAQRALTRAVRLRDDSGLRKLQAQVTRLLTEQTQSEKPVPSVHRPEVGTELDGWALEARLGSGGWGQVFRARRGGQVRALKVLHPELADRPGAVQRFQAEVLTLASLRGLSPHLVRVEGFGFDRARSCWYLLMEFVEGQTLEQFLLARGPLPEGRAAELFGTLAEGLGQVHARGVVHRDVKPANILLRPDDTPVLVDFGLAGEVDPPGGTLEGGAGFTMAFAAPEQLRGREADSRSDVYGLAASLYYALVYDRPQLREPADFDPAALPEGLREVLTRALSQSPALRHGDGAELSRALRGEDGRSPTEEPFALDPVATPPGPPASPGETRPEAPAIHEKLQEDPEAVAALKQLGSAVSLRQDPKRPGNPVVKVRISYDHVRDAHLAPLKGLPHLEELSLDCSSVTDAGLAHLTGHTRLRALDLGRTKVSDAGLAHLAQRTGCHRLQRLRVTRSVTDAGLAHLAGFTELQRLELWGTKITDAGLEHLAALPALSWLSLAGTPITGAGLAHLTHLPLLSLRLYKSGLSDEGVKHLGRIASLKHLDLGSTQVTDAGLDHLAPLLNLEKLCLCGLKLTRVGLRHLKGVVGLRWLNLGGALKTSDAELAPLGELRSLRGLSLSGCELTDRGTRHLRGLVNLEGLNLHGTRVSDQGLADLVPLRRLKWLYLGGTRVTQGGWGGRLFGWPCVPWLQKQLPECRIIIDRHSPSLPSFEMGKFEGAD